MAQASQQQQAAPGGMPFMVQQGPPQIPFNRRWHIAKIAIRGWSAVFAVIIIIMAAVLAVKAGQLYESYLSNGYYSGSYDIAFVLWVTALPPASLVLLWDIAEFITLCARRKSSGRGIHPGAHVGVDLILWMALVIIWGLLSAVISYLPDLDYDYSSGSYTVPDNYDPSVRAMAIAIMVFLIILSIIHFFLFVRACVETDQRNRLKRNPGPIMILPTPGAQNHAYYNLNSQPMWFQPTPASKRSKKAGLQTLQPMMTPPQANVQIPAQSHGNYYPYPATMPQPSMQPPAGTEKAAQPAQNPEFSGYYAPQGTANNDNNAPPMSGYYAPSTTTRGVEVGSSEMSQVGPSAAGPSSEPQPRPGTAK